MITNRNIETVALFEDALDEVIASARENGVEDAALATVLRAQADALENPVSPSEETDAQ